MRIAVLGGTGRQGSGLALRWARAGHQVYVGSRSADRADRAARALNGRVSSVAGVVGLTNQAAAAAGEVAVLSIPYGAQLPLLETVLEELSGKVLITVVVPLRPPQVSWVWQPEAGSAAQEAQALLGSATSVVAAFHNVSSGHLARLEHQIDCDVLVCGDSESDKAVAARLAADAGMRALDAGPLCNASVVEGLTAVLIGLNARYGVEGAGIRITGLNA
jgi:NADPH-dependent F420 reductase